VFWELSDDLFSVYDAEERFVDVNPAWQRVLGWRPDQMLGRPVADFRHPADVETAEGRWLCADGRTDG